MLVIARHAEIALKGGNRNFFEKKLMENLREQAAFRGLPEPRVRKDMGRVVCDFATDDKDALATIFTHTFGVKNFSFVERIDVTEESILRAAKGHLEAMKKKGATRVSLETKRAWKAFPKKSLEINMEIGAIANSLGLKIDFSQRDHILHLEITKDAAYVSSDKRNGPGGLPIGTGGKVLVLLSGGIDSAVAAYQLMRRGCRIDYLHVHLFPENADVLATKIPKIVGKLQEYQPRATLLLAPYHEYQLRTVGAIPQHLDLVGFKHFLLRVADDTARKNKYRAIVTGDALAQVASQTLPNLAAQRHGIETLILSPLIGFDKQDIIDVSARADVFVEGPYKDCCSIVAKKASTAVDAQELQRALADSPFTEALENTLAQVTAHQF